MMNVNVAERFIASDPPRVNATLTTAGLPFINLRSTGGNGDFNDSYQYGKYHDKAFPGLVQGTDSNNFAVLATSTVTIPSAGQWTFSVNSDEGFRLTLTGYGQTYTSEYVGERTLGHTYATFNIASSGDYALRLVYFEHLGDSSLELSAASGSHNSWDGSFRLVGDTGNGGLSAVSAVADRWQ